MASFFRSIGVKIFGIAVGLLVLMIATSLLSGALSTYAHRQMRTLSYSLFPLTVTLTDLRSSLQTHRREMLTRDRGPGSGDICRRIAAARSEEATQLIRRAEALRQRGVELAVLQRNRLKLAKLEPMIAQMAREQAQLDALVTRQCAAPAGSALSAQLDADVDAHVAELVREVAAVTREIGAFVTEGAAIVERNQELALRANIGLIGASGLVGLLLAYLVVRGLTQPITRLRAGARAVEDGRLDTEVPVTSADEIGDVTRAFNTMIAGLRAKERIKETFGQYVDPRVVASLVDGSADRLSAGEKQVATIYFSDMAGFTAIAERLAPSTVVTLTNAFISEMSGPIRERQGFIDKYLGDGIMAFWAPPFADPSEQAALACAAVLEQYERLDAFRQRVPDLLGLRRDIPAIGMRVGLSTGEVVVGSIGSDVARSFTVIGDTVNFGSRLEGANKAYGTQVLIDERTRDLAGDGFATREVDRVALVGRDEPIRIFELVGRTLTAGQRELFDLYAEGLARYRAGDWEPAEAAFGEALALTPSDGPSAAMLDRTRRLRADPPVGWEGVWRLTRK